MIVDQVRGVRSSSGAPLGRRVMVTAEPPKLGREGSIPSRPADGTIVQPGERYPRTVEIGVRVPVAPLNGPMLVGYQSATLNLPTCALCPFQSAPPRRARESGRSGTATQIQAPTSPWGRSSIGRASDWQSEGSRFDPGRLHCKTKRTRKKKRINLMSDTSDVNR